MYFLLYHHALQQMKNNSRIDLIAEQKHLLDKIYSQGQNLWKIVIFDHFNMEINSSLFKMKNFYQKNITLYFNLKDRREQLHGVTAIYLVRPLPENVDLIVKDFQEDLYSSVIIHFSAQPSSHILSTLASNLSKKKINCLSRISKVEFSCIGFHTIDRMMAILPENNEILNLLGILKGKVIFVHGTKQQQQVKFLKGQLEDSMTLSKQPKQNTNLLLFFNRQLDYFPVLSHAIDYASLIQNVYKISSNGHAIIKQKQKTHIKIDLNDEIWIDCKNMEIPDMNLDEELNKIKVKLSNEKDQMDQFHELTEKSKKIGQHCSLVQQLMRQAKSRRLNEFHQLQLQIYKLRVLGKQLKKQVLHLLQNGTNTEDKIRLVLIIILYCDHIDPKEIEQFEGLVPELKKSNFYNQIKTKRIRSQMQQNKVTAGGIYLTKFAKGIFNNFKNNDKLLICRYIDKVKDLRQNDLKQLALTTTSLGDIPADVKINNIIVYVNGGVCFNEQSEIKKSSNRVIYTGDKFISAREIYQCL